jgi:hypothetical protein
VYHSDPYRVICGEKISYIHAVYPDLGNALSPMEKPNRLHGLAHCKRFTPHMICLTIHRFADTLLMLPRICKQQIQISRRNCRRRMLCANARFAFMLCHITLLSRSACHSYVICKKKNVRTLAETGCITSGNTVCGGINKFAGLKYVCALLSLISWYV